MNPLFLCLDEVFLIHESRLEKYGGSSGLRDEGLLKSALAMPESCAGGDFLHESIFGMSAAYLFHISKNHPFVDGNKRTALAVALVFLEINGYELIVDNPSLENLVIDTVTGKLSKNEIADFLEKYSRRK